jgi:hypothetical protein
MGLHDLAQTIGELPGGDIPAAWYASMTDEVINAYDKYLADQRAWNNRYAELLKTAGLPPNCQFLTEGGRGHLLGIVAPRDLNTPPRWLKWEKGRILVPRKRTTAERQSIVRSLFLSLTVVPRPIDYIPGMPHTLLVGVPGDMTQRAYAPQVRRPAQAVLVFLAADPADAAEPFEPDGNWARMKLSSFHQLKERQDAARATA